MKLKHPNKKFIGIPIIYIQAYTYTYIHNFVTLAGKKELTNICKGVGHWEAQGIQSYNIFVGSSGYKKGVGWG